MKFSIVTPSFNQANYIEQTINSVLSQAGKFDIEHIVIDGGSSDGTQELLKQFQEKYAHDARVTFHWLSEPDEGQADAINKGLRLVSGDIVAYLNSDDVYEAGAFQAVQDFFEVRPEIGFVYGKCRIINEEGKEIRKFIKHYRTWLGRKYSYSKLLAENFVPQPATFWRAEVHRKIGEFDTSQNLCLDYEYWCRMGKDFKGAFLNSYLASFRWYPSSKSGSLFRDQFLDELAIAKRYADKKHALSLAIHRFNVWKITTVYRVMQALRV